jgi:hypothetical protein
MSQQGLADFFCVKELESNFPGGFGVFRIVTGDFGKAFCRFLDGCEG